MGDADFAINRTSRPKNETKPESCQHLEAILAPGLGYLGDARPGGRLKIRVTATVSMVTDLVKQVGGDRVEVSGLMGAGVDPHLYKATAADVSNSSRPM